MISIEAMGVLANALDDARVDVTATQLVAIVSYFARYGHHLVPVAPPMPQAAVPIVEPYAQPPVTTAYWLPRGVSCLWVKLADNDIVPLANAFELVMWKARGLTFAAADTRSEAEVALNAIPGDYNVDRFTFEGATYEYLSDNIPF